MASMLSFLNRADGSARFSQGETQVMVGVYGPAPCPINMEQYNRATLSVVWKPKSGAATIQDAEREHCLQTTLEPFILLHLHPRSLITVIVQVLNDAGSVMSTAVNAACLALMDCGIHMKALPLSITCAVLPTADSESLLLSLDPTTAEEKQASSVCTTVFSVSRASPKAPTPSKPQLTTWLQDKGAIDDDTLFAVLDMCTTACPILESFLRSYVAKQEILLSPNYELVAALDRVVSPIQIQQQQQQLMGEWPLGGQLLTVFLFHKRLPRVLRYCVSCEVQSASRPSELFTSTTTTSSLLSSFLQAEGGNCLQYLVDPFIEKVESLSFPSLSIEEVIGLVDGLTSSILNFPLDGFPATIRKLANLFQAVAESQRLEMTPIQICGSFFFMRFLCPAFIFPELYGLSSAEVDSPIYILATNLFKAFQWLFTSNEEPEEALAPLCHALYHRLPEINAFLARFTENLPVEDIFECLPCPKESAVNAALIEISKVVCTYQDQLTEFFTAQNGSSWISQLKIVASEAESLFPMVGAGKGVSEYEVTEDDVKKEIHSILSMYTRSYETKFHQLNEQCKQMSEEIHRAAKIYDEQKKTLKSHENENSQILSKLTTSQQAHAALSEELRLLDEQYQLEKQKRCEAETLLEQLAQVYRDRDSTTVPSWCEELLRVIGECANETPTPKKKS
ncbi:exosome complex component RRP46 [Pelomyxa schiedti]|nr:exosome complex component RRP46 [Pelomyxa schiedti]